MNIKKFFSNVKQITYDELSDAQSDKNTLIIDVRQPNEYKTNSIKKADFIPLTEIHKKFMEPDKNKKIVLYCRSGKRSNLAARILMVKGYNNVFSLSGGIKSVSK